MVYRMEHKNFQKPHVCPVCGKHEFPSWDSYDICPECGWEDSAFQEKNPDNDAGPNDGMTLNEYKAKYESGWRPEWLDSTEEDAEEA